MVYIVKVFILLSLTLNLYSSTGITQTHLISTTPASGAINVAIDTSIIIKFDTAIEDNSLSSNTLILLDKNSENIQGTLTRIDDATISFNPKNRLQEGEYKVILKPITLQNGIINIPTQGYRYYLYKMCSYLYEDIKECPLCKYFCREESITTQEIHYSFSTNSSAATISSLLIEPINIELNLGKSKTITLLATYSDGNTSELNTSAEWIIEDNSTVSVNNKTITSLKMGETTLQAKVKNILSNSLHVKVFEEINGYILPPEPDPQVNNSTLLGIDSNDNGIRDDVERWIIIAFSKAKFQNNLYLTDYFLRRAVHSTQLLKHPNPTSELTFELYINNAKDNLCACLMPEYQLFKKYRDLYKDHFFNTEERLKVFFKHESVLPAFEYLTHRGGKTGMQIDKERNECDERYNNFRGNL